MAGESGGIAASVRRQLAEGRSPEEIVETLAAQGLSKPSAQRFVDRALAEQPAPVESPAPPADDPAIPPLDAPFEAAPEMPADASGQATPPQLYEPPPPLLDTPEEPELWWKQRKVLIGASAAVILLLTVLVVRNYFSERAERQIYADEDAAMAELIRESAARRSRKLNNEMYAELDKAAEGLRQGSYPCMQANIIAQSSSTAYNNHLEAALRDLRSSEKPCIASALARLGREDLVLGTYNYWIEGNDVELWRSAIVGYGELGPMAARDAVPALHRALQSDDVYLRSAAVRTAIQIGADAEEILEAAAEDEEPQIATTARRALATLHK